MSWIIEVYHVPYGWKNYLRRFSNREEALTEAKNMYEMQQDIKNFKVRMLTPMEEENYKERNFV